MPSPDGGVSVIGSDGVPVGQIAAPWAYDANGTGVDTSYRIDGSTLIQNVDHVGATYPVVADPSFQFDCGWISCTLRFNRVWTRNVRDGSWVIAGFLGLCTAATAGVGALVCAAVAARFVIDAVVAGRFYENGNCIKYKIAVSGTGVTVYPEELKKGTYNCV